MVEGDVEAVAADHPPAVEGGDPAGTREQPGQGVPAQDQDDVGADDLDLSVEEGGAGIHLGGLGVAVAGRPALDHVGDVDVVPVEPDALEEPGEHVPGGADEGLADPVLGLPGALPHRHDPRRPGPVPGTAWMRAAVERAGGAGQDVIVDDGKCVRGAGQHRAEFTGGDGVRNGAGGSDSERRSPSVPVPGVTG